MSGGITESPDQTCWANAIKASNDFLTFVLPTRAIFNKTLTKDSEKKIGITKSHGGTFSPCSLRDMVKEAREAQAKSFREHVGLGVARPTSGSDGGGGDGEDGEGDGSSRKSIGQWLDTLAQAALRYAPAADVVVQSEPHAAAAWGAVRFLIRVAVANIEAREKIGQALVSIVQQVGRYEIEARLFSQFDRVQAAISLLFAHILHYLANAISHYKKSRPARWSRVAFGRSLSKFDLISSDIREQAMVLDREIRAAAEEKQTDLALAGELEELRAELFRCEFRQAFHEQSLDTFDHKRLMLRIRAKQDDLGAESREMHAKMGMAMEDRRQVELRDKGLEMTLQWLRIDLKVANAHHSREEGTCLWLGDHPVYQSWRQSGCCTCLWIYGKPGCGKSVMATQIAETAKTETEIVLTFFFRDSGGRQSTLSTTLAVSLLINLFQTEALIQHPRVQDVIKTLMPLRESYETGCSSPLKELLKVLDFVLSLLPPFTLIVDALDECTDLEDSDLLDYLQTLNLRSPARVILLSRKEARFSDILKDAAQVHMDESVVGPDVLHFVKQEINRSRQLHPLEGEILRKISRDSDGMFLWAKLVLDAVKDADTIKLQRKKLEAFPPGLVEVYRKELENNSKQMDVDRLQLRQQIFLLLIEAIEPLTVEDISTALALDCSSNRIDEEGRLLDPTNNVLKLCKPLVTVVNGQSHLIHTTVKEFLLQLHGDRAFCDSIGLHLSRDDSNSFLALKSLSKLNQAEYRLWKCPASLLRKHLLVGGVITRSVELPDDENKYKESTFYNYACLHWHEHVTELKRPSDKILENLRQFLTGNEFVTWAEILFELKDRSGLSPHVKVRSTLQKWYKFLLPETREQIPISAFFVTSHETLSRELVKKGQDGLLPLLPLTRLGEFFNLGAESRGDWQKAYEYKKTVVEGYQSLLGKRNPLTLRARTSLLQEYFWQTRFDEAERGLREVAAAQLEVIDVELGIADYFTTLQFLGLAQFYLNEFSESCLTLEKSGKGLRKLLSPSNLKFLMTELYNGYALEAQAKLKEAYHLYSDIWERWTPLFGPSNPFSLMVQCAMGSIHRKSKHFDEAEKVLLDSWTDRLRLFGIGNNVCVDSAIQLAVLYRDMDRGSKTLELLDTISTSSIFPSDFERVCQIRHLRALVAFDAGEYRDPKLSLLRLLNQAAGPGPDREKNNRELLWVRITLSDVLRSRGENDEASMLFSDLVEPDTDGETRTDTRAPVTPNLLGDEPEPPSQLAFAEKALRYVRGAKLVESRKLLEEHQLRWVRKRDFWIMQGGPITDTAAMVGVRI